LEWKTSLQGVKDGSKHVKLLYGLSAVDYMCPFC